jgi:rod shape-determining protein MreC
MGLSDYLRGTLQTVASPFQRAFTWAADALSGFGEYFTAFDELSAENEALRKQLDEASDQLYNARLLEEENEWLRNYLGLKRLHTDYRFEEATVIGREGGNSITVLTLNRGSLHGIKEGMPVMTDAGIVGAVVEVGATWCRAETLLETAAAVGAYVERSAQSGVVSGSFSLSSEGFCVMQYLPDGADIRVGDRIITSGVSSIYPPGLYIGEVTAIMPDPYSRSVTAEIALAVKPSELSRVMILTDFASYTE